jgi:hypothetical protein
VAVAVAWTIGAAGTIAGGNWTTGTVVTGTIGSAGDWTITSATIWMMTIERCDVFILRSYFPSYYVPIF